jgi:hypothetical protein
MTREPEWTADEFDLLARNDALSNEALAALLPRRSPGAVAAVRGGIHQFHRKGESTMISKLAKGRLTLPGRVLVCHICGERI